MIWDSGMLLSLGIAVGRERIWKGKRIWDPKHSKLSALYHKINIAELELTSAMRVLYLGAGNGTTVSFVADYVEVVYAIDPAPEPMADVLSLAQKRANIIPLLSDARKPEGFSGIVEEVDVVYQDVAQPTQVDIFISNCNMFLKQGGIGILMLKTRSVDVRQDPKEVSLAAVDVISCSGYTILDSVWLVPWHQDHSALLCRKM